LLGPRQRFFFYLRFCSSLDGQSERASSFIADCLTFLCSAQPEIVERSRIQEGKKKKKKLAPMRRLSGSVGVCGATIRVRGLASPAFSANVFDQVVAKVCDGGCKLGPLLTAFVFLGAAARGSLQVMARQRGSRRAA
jgi:hypothetical protein